MLYLWMCSGARLSNCSISVGVPGTSLRLDVYNIKNLQNYIAYKSFFPKFAKMVAYEKFQGYSFSRASIVLCTSGGLEACIRTKEVHIVQVRNKKHVCGMQP